MLSEFQGRQRCMREREKKILIDKRRFFSNLFVGGEKLLKGFSSVLFIFDVILKRLRTRKRRSGSS